MNNDVDNDSDDSGIRYQMAGVVAGVLLQAPQNIYETGCQMVDDTLSNTNMCCRTFRMPPHIFLLLHEQLVNSYGLRSWQNVGTEETLGMFLFSCGKRQDRHQISDRFRRPYNVVIERMTHIIEVMFTFAQEMICPKDPTFSQVSGHLLKYAPFFDGCLGALDGTHVKIQVSSAERELYLNRKGETSFNVLAIVDFDMRFTYVGAGMAGRTHDMRVLETCQTQPRFPHPPQGMLASDNSPDASMINLYFW